METSEQGLKQSEKSSKKGGNPPPPNVKLQFNVVASTKSGSLTYELKPTDAKFGAISQGVKQPDRHAAERTGFGTTSFSMSSTTTARRKSPLTPISRSAPKSEPPAPQLAAE